MKITKHIEIVCSTNRRLSSMSKESRDAIFATISKRYTNVGITIVNNMADLIELVDKKPDLAFLGMKFIPSPGAQNHQKIWLAQYLADNDIAHTGSGHEAHYLELNKPQAKQRILNSGLETSQYTIAKNGIAPAPDTLPSYPLFVKPSNRGGGAGIDSDSVVHDFAALQSKITSIFTTLHCDVLIEKYLPGREFSVAILKNGQTAEYQAMPIELVAEPDHKGSRLLSSAVKASNTEVVSVVADPIIKSRVCSLAIAAFHALGGQDYGRIDIRLDEFDNAHFLEANLLPSLIRGYGSFPKACEMNIGLSYEDMIHAIVRLALARTVHHELPAAHSRPLRRAFAPLA